MNTEQLHAEWARMCEVIRNYPTIDSSQMNAFFTRIQPQAMSDDFIMLTADNDFIKTWIERHYADYIKRALKDIHGVDFSLAIEVDVNQEAQRMESIRFSEAAVAPEKQEAKDERPQVEEAKPADAPTENGGDAAMREEVGNKPEVPKPVNGSKIDNANSSLTFENFVIGESNRMAYSAAVAVAEQPGEPFLNPLFIYGKSGLGKTHLMCAIKNYIEETRPDLSVVYEDSADFLARYVEATLSHDKEKSSFKFFKNHYQDADVLLIDDIQFLQGKQQTLDIVFQIFNKMVSEGKQVILSADRSPKNIDMDERYQSRFNSGGTFDIQPPEVETKLGIIKRFVEEYRDTSDRPGFSIPENIERYIAENSSSNIRELKSAVTKVIYMINAFDREDISIEEVSNLLENHFSGGAMKKLTIADIQKQVELYYDVTHSDLIGQKRARRIVYARQVAIYLCRQLLEMPYNNIAKSFGGRDHTTIMYSVTNIEEKMKENRELREEIENIKRKIRDM